MAVQPAAPKPPPPPPPKPAAPPKAPAPVKSAAPKPSAPKPAASTPAKTAPAVTKPPIQVQRRTGAEPAVAPVQRDRPTTQAAPGLNDTMNRYLGTTPGAAPLAQDMARVSNDPQFRQNPDATQHAAIRAMGEQRDHADFRRTIGDTARSRAFSGLEDQAQVALMDRLGAADQRTRDAYQEMWRSNEFQHAAVAQQATRLQEFDRRQAEDRRVADQRDADQRDVARREERAAEVRANERPPPAPAQPAHDPRLTTHDSDGPLPPGALLRAANEGIRRVVPAPTQPPPPQAQPPKPPPTGGPDVPRTPPAPPPPVDHNGMAYRTGPDGRYRLPVDPTQATPRQFLEGHVLPAMRGATHADGSPRYPRSVQEIERTLGRMARDPGLTTEWERNGSSWAAGRYGANGELIGTRTAINAQLAQEWNNIEAGVRAGTIDPSQRMSLLHEAAGRFMDDMSHEFAHRQGMRSQERIFDPAQSRDENVRRLTDDALADEASRARNGHRAESVFAQESDRAGGYRPQRDHSVFQRALDDARVGRVSPGDAQRRVIDHVAGLQPGGHPAGTTYRDLYRQNAEIEYDRMMARHQARAVDPNARPAADPNARQPAELGRVRRNELQLGQHLGSGAHSNTYALGDREVAIMFQQNARGAEAGQHLTDQVEYMRSMQGVQFEGRSVAPGVSRFITDDNGQVMGYVAERVRGEELGAIAARGGLNEQQYGEVQRQLRGQMDELHRAGFIHGDANSGNVLVDVKPDGSVEARYLDFERPTDSFGARDDRALLEQTLERVDHSRQPEQVRQYWEGKERARVDADRRRLVDTQRPRAEEVREGLRDLRRGLPEGDEVNRQLLQDVRETLGMGGRESRLWSHDDFIDARQRLTDTNASERLRGMELTGDAARTRDELVRNLDEFQRDWQPVRPADPDGARAELEGRGAPHRPSTGAQRGREIVDDVVRHRIDEAYRNGPEPLRNLRGQLGADHQRMLDDMLTRLYDGDATRLNDALQRDTNLDRARVERKLEGFDRGRAAATERDRVRLEDARRRADEVMRYPTTQGYLDQARRGMADADRMIGEVERAGDFAGRDTLLNRLRTEREELAQLTDRDRRLGDITDKNVGGARNNVRGYGEEWRDIDDRLRQGHRVQYGGGADVVDHTAREAVQHKASASNDPNQARQDLRRANQQLGAAGGERPPEGYRRVVSMTVEGDSHLVGADRQRLLDEAAEAFRGQDLEFDEVRFRAPGGDVTLSRADVEARIRGRGGDGGRPQDGDRPPPDQPRDGARPAPADPLHPDVRGAMNQRVLDGLSQDDLRRVGELTQDANARGSVSDLLRNARSPEEARQIMSTLEGVPAGSRQAVAQAISAMGQGDLGQVHRMMQSLPGESREAIGRVLGNLSREHGADFLRIAQHLEGRELGAMVGTIDTAVSNLARHAPGMLDNVGRMFTAMNQMVGRLGLQMTGQVAGRVMRGVGAMLPAVGTAFSAYDFARMTRVAADGTLPAELRFLGGAGMALNGVDTALGVAEMFGIGNIGLPANLALGAAALGLDLYTHHQIDQFRANPDGWQPSRNLNAFVAGTALAMGPTGAALLVGTFGASGAQEKMIDLGQVGGELAINGARLGGVAMADAAGGGMRFTAGGIDAMAEMIRDPARFGRVMQELGVGAQQFARNALEGLGNAAQYAGELGQRAVRAIGNAGTWLADRGAEGLETLRWMATPENWPAMGEAAQRGITEVIRRGGELGRAALDGLQDLGQRGLEMGRHAIGALRDAGEQGLEMLNHAYRRFRENPTQAFRDLGNAAIDGISDLARRGGELGQRAVRSLIDWVNDQPRLAQRAVTALRDLATQGGAALEEIANAWGRNLTEGGRAVLGSLENLGNAGAEALGRLGARGGEMAMAAAQSLGRMVNRGYEAATQALQTAARALSPENLQRFLIDQPARAARAVFDSLGGQRIAEMLNGLQNAPEMMRRLYDQMDWRHVRDTVGRLGNQAMTAMVSALDPRRLREFIGHFDGGVLRQVWDGMTGWGGARRLFEAAGEGLTRKLADAIGSHNIAGLVNAANTSVDWIRTHLSGALQHMQGFGDLLQQSTAAGLRKLRDVVGVDRIAGTIRQMRDAGIQLGENLVNGARELGDRAIQEAAGLVQAAQQHVEHVVQSYDNGIVHPFHPDAVWWIGRNPFRRN